MSDVKAQVKLTCTKTLKRNDGSLQIAMIVKAGDEANIDIPAGNMILQIPKESKMQLAFIENGDYLVDLTLIQKQ